MAHVSFANARIELINGEAIASNYELSLRGTGDTSETTQTVLYDSNNDRIVQNYSSRRILNTPSRISFLYTGIFIVSGTEAYLRLNSYTNLCWKFSNISFQAGDDYSFIVDVDMNPS